MAASGVAPTTLCTALTTLSSLLNTQAVPPKLLATACRQDRVVAELQRSCEGVRHLLYRHKPNSKRRHTMAMPLECGISSISSLCSHLHNKEETGRKLTMATPLARGISAISSLRSCFTSSPVLILTGHFSWHMPSAAGDVVVVVMSCMRNSREAGRGASYLARQLSSFEH